MAVKRAWTNPAVYALDGPDNRPLKVIFESLTTFLASHVGVWGTATGATDANGFCTFTHDAGFIPTSVLITEEYVSGAAHDMGPCHLHETTDTTFQVHFLTKSGQDRGTHDVHVHYLVLPPTRVRD